MLNIKSKISLLLFITFITYTPLFAQGCFEDVVEEELLHDFKEIKRLQNKLGEDNMDSLYAANKKFYFSLSYQGEHNLRIISDVNRFMYEGMDFSVSDDYTCALFSWEVYSFQGLHQRSGVLFYKTQDGIHSIQYTNGVAPYYVSAIKIANGQKAYLLFYEDDYSLKGRGKMVSANVIDSRFGPETLAPKSFFYNGKNDSSAYLEYKYDLESYTFPKTVPCIILSPGKKQLSMPVVNKDGSFMGKYRIYNFDGNKFVLSQTESK